MLAEAAAGDLGVGVGDTITLTHPLRTGPASFALTQSEVVVAAIHNNPLRFAAYMDDAALTLADAEGLANVIYANPAPGYTPEDVQRDLFTLGSISSAEKASASADDLDKLIGEFVGILQGVAVFVLLLAVLMAFNSASIGFEERQREHATMFAYGVRVRKALRMAVVENLVIGVVATALGLVGGLAMIWWVVNVSAAETMPDIGLIVEMSPTHAGHGDRSRSGSRRHRPRVHGAAHAADGSAGHAARHGVIGSAKLSWPSRSSVRR